MIPHSRLSVEEEDLAAVARVIQSGQWAQGEEVAAFERDMAAFLGMAHGAAVNSGTAALHLSLVALGAGPGDEVIIPSYVCTALLHAVRHAGAVPVLVDVDPATGNIDPGEVRRAAGAKTRAVIVPHLFGLPAEVERIVDLGLPVIEDCAQSVGARIEGRMAGSIGTVAVTSFYATKMLGAGEGGMVLSKDPAIIERVRDRREYDEKETDAVRFNYKMTEMQAALGRSRLRRLSQWIERRRAIAESYRQGLTGTPAGLPREPAGREHTYFRFVIDVEGPDGIMAGLRERGVMARRPVYRPLHRYLGLPGFPASDRLWSRAVSLPIYPSLDEEEIRTVVEAVRSAAEEER